MSPEQACGAETVDARTDIWSLGVVMYQCLAGTIPFRASNYNAQMVAIMTRAHRALREVAPGVDAELSALVEACLAKEREHRVQTARELAERLSAIARRLAEKSPGALLAPRRRATDRLRGRAVAVELPLDLLPLPVRSYRRLRSIRPSRGVVGVVSLIIGALAGGAAAGGWERIVAPPPASAPGRIEGAILPPAAGRSASAAMAPKDLAVASRTKSPASAP
jgi:serine/threonine protein kinase